MGINYFYLGNMKSAAYYHDRSIKGTRELDTSYSKQYGLDNLQMYIS